MIFSAFTSYGFLAYSSLPSVHERVYTSMKTALGGDLPSTSTYDFNEGTHVEASLYARSKAIAAVISTTERAGNQSDPAETLEMMPVLEKDRRIVVPADATIEERRAVLIARSKDGEGATRQSIENQLRAVLGDDFIAYVPVPEADQDTWPIPLGSSPGVYTQPDGFAPKHMVLAYGNTAPGSQWVGYYLLTTDPIVINVGDYVCMNAGDLDFAERVLVTDARTSPLGILEFQATFANTYSAGMFISTGPFPAQFSTRRFSYIVVTPEASLDPVRRAKVDAVMNRIARNVSEWTVVQESAPGFVGPYIIGTSPLGLAPFISVPV